MNKRITFLGLALSAGFACNAFAAPYQTIEVSNGGKLSGKVNFSGTDPAPAVYAITKDQETCGNGDRKIDFVKVNNGALGDVVVYLDKVKEGKAFANAEAGKGKLNQKGCAFDPFLQVMYDGEQIDILNSDPVSHNIHTYELIGKTKKTVLNISQPEQNSVIKKDIKLKRGTAMKLECDQHDFMHGFVFVAKNPYFAVVDTNGQFSIDNIPPGKYTVKSWHGTLGEQKAKVTIEGGKSASVNLTYK
ncbi:MAG: hypothetical protein RQ982_05240 [Gammaproteobacteria bacterium]|nr:hypothetical protein [Gammaproteobacteria bacterium]